MDNENKDFELESQNMGPESLKTVPEYVETEPASVEAEMPEIEPAAEEEFDPTESEDFYNNLDAVIGEEEVSDDEIPELLLNDEIFSLEGETEKKETPQEEDLFNGVDAALAEQIESEFGENPETSSTVEKEPGALKRFWKSIPKWTKILVSTILVVLVSVGLLFGTAGGR